MYEMKEELHLNPFLVEGSGPPNEAGKQEATHLYVAFENITMPLDIMSDEVSVKLSKAQIELIMACLSLQCEY